MLLERMSAAPAALIDVACKRRSGPAWYLSSSRLLGHAQAEKEIAAAVRPGDCLGDGAQGRVNNSLVLEATFQDLYLEITAFVRPGQHAAGCRQTRVGPVQRERSYGPPRYGGLCARRGGIESYVGLVSQLGGP